jgi:hypothetical protein
MSGRGNLFPTEDTWLLASERQANRHVLAGLVHAAKGPLNNFSLTLTLLADGVAHADTSSLPPEMLARWTRHIDVLRSETLCLARCVDDIHALTLRHEPALDAIDLCAILRECEHALHHDATMREIVLSLHAPETPVYGMGDPRLVRLALLSFTICLLDLTQPGGRGAWRAVTNRANRPSPSRRRTRCCRRTSSPVSMALPARANPGTPQRSRDG